MGKQLDTRSESVASVRDLGGDAANETEEQIINPGPLAPEMQFNHIIPTEEQWSSFKMSRSIVKASDAWDEYRYGRVSPDTGHRQPAIKDLDSQHGSKWRGPKSSTEGTFYRRREPLWLFIEKVLQQRPTMRENDLLAELDRLQGKRPLRNFCTYLQKILQQAGPNDLLETESNVRERTMSLQ
jgi:hypothetical protein